MAVPPGYVALVNQKGILLNDFRAQVELETTKHFADATPAERRRVLREMINEELLVQRAVVLDLPETANEVRATMAVGVNGQVAAPVLAYEPTDAELRAFYEKSRQNYATPGSMTLHDLVLRVGGYQNADQTTTQAQVDAAEAVYQLRSGASLDYVMAHFGFMPSGRAADGEELDFAAKLHLGEQLYAVAATMRDGEVSDPIVDSGWHAHHRHGAPSVSEGGRLHRGARPRLSGLSHRRVQSRDEPEPAPAAQPGEHPARAGTVGVKRLALDRTVLARRRCGRRGGAGPQRQLLDLDRRRQYGDVALSAARQRGATPDGR